MTKRVLIGLLAAALLLCLPLALGYDGGGPGCKPPFCGPGSPPPEDPPYCAPPSNENAWQHSNPVPGGEVCQSHMPETPAEPPAPPNNPHTGG